MSHSSGLPSDVIWLILVPPVMAGMFYLLSRVWTGVLGTAKRPRVLRWTKSGFWIVMGGLYVIGIALFIYAHFIR